MPEKTWEGWYGELDKKTIMRWIVEHCDDVEAMDCIQKVVFPFSSKFAKKPGYAAQGHN